MSEAAMNRETIETAIRQRANDDETFRAALVADPSVALESAFGVSIPGTIAVRIVEERPEEVVLVLPAAHDQRPLTEEELSSIFGGTYDGQTHVTCRY